MFRGRQALQPLAEGLDQTTEVDGVSVPKAGEAPIKPGSQVRVARVLTLEFLGESFKAGESTRYKL